MRPVRIAFALAVVAFIAFLGPVYASNLAWFFSASSGGALIQGNWPVVLLYIAVFCSFLFFLAKHPLSKGSWRKESGVYMAFIIALFAEMFGFPLTIYLLSALGAPAVPSSHAPPVAFSFGFFGINYELLVTSLFAGLLSLACFAVVLLAWRQVYSAKGLATNGLYSVVRHPQYSALMTTVIIWALAWPTLLTLALCPVLLFAYYRLARREERELQKEYPKYLGYKGKVPMLVP